MNPREEGMTLIELLVALAILGLVMSAIATAFFTYLENLESTNKRYSSSNDGEAAAAFFANDVQSANLLTSDVCESAGVGSTPSPGSPAPIVSFRITDTVTASPSTTQQVVVSYVTEAAGANFRFVRRQCVGSTGADDTVISGALDTVPAVECNPAPCLPNSRSVTVTFTTKDGYTFRLSGARRSDT